MMVVYTGSLKDIRDPRILELSKGKKQSIGAWTLLAAGLKDRGYDFKDMEFARNEHGKPYISNHPDLFFNLSHSEDRVMCIIGSMECGCDVEKKRKIKERIAKRFFCEGEYEEALRSSDREDMILRLWTLKESFVKEMGRGLGMALGSFEIKMGDRIAVEYDGDEVHSLYELMIDEEYRYACSIRGESSMPEIKRIDLGEWNLCMKEIYEELKRE